MTTLRQNFIRELVIRGMSPRTQETYVGAVYRLARHYRRSPDLISDEELKNYVFHLAKDKHLAASSLNQVVSAFRLFYETVLQRSMVPSSTDGCDPKDALIEGPDQLLYGTTYQGGTAGRGTVFKIGKDGSGYQIIRHFQNDGTGSQPESRLLFGSDGYLYGTTDSSSPGTGVVIYKLKADGSEYRVLAKLGGAKLRGSALVEMPDGLLYGTASDGGRPIPASGYLYRIAKDGSDYEVLHEFLPAAPGGRFPWAGFLKGLDGELYGTTLAGGTNGAGVIYKLARAGSQSNPPVVLVPSVVAGGTAFQLSFTGAPLGQYEIQGTSQLPSGWQILTNVQAGDNGQVEYLDLISGTNSRYYRVRSH